MGKLLMLRSKKKDVDDAMKKLKKLQIEMELWTDDVANQAHPMAGTITKKMAELDIKITTTKDFEKNVAKFAVTVGLYIDPVKKGTKETWCMQK